MGSVKQGSKSRAVAKAGIGMVGTVASHPFNTGACMLVQALAERRLLEALKAMHLIQSPEATHPDSQSEPALSKAE